MQPVMFIRQKLLKQYRENVTDIGSFNVCKIYFFRFFCIYLEGMVRVDLSDDEQDSLN